MALFKKAAKVDKLTPAKDLCREWWGRGLGTTGSLRGILRELSEKELQEIEDFVPMKSEGITGTRIDALRKIIDQVQAERK